ncbi:MAG: tetratricopeptide repeat protein, partial [Candidatus Sericytochromatia bacterium]
YTNLGTVYYAQGKIEDAKTQYEAALKINPRDTSSTENLGIIYERMGQKEKAKELYKKACMLGSDSACDYLGRI